VHAATQLSHRRLQRFQALVCLLLLLGLPSTDSRYLVNAVREGALSILTNSMR
jgi:hypothetical protein